MTTIQLTLARIDFDLVRNYLAILSGSMGRLVVSMAYFIAIANALSLADFGLFATASATGVVLSRVAAFGFISPLYRTATVRRRLLGVFTSGYLVAFTLSLPVLLGISWLIFALVFSAHMSLIAFAIIMAAEIVAWRLCETVIIVNNGLNRFAIGSVLTVLGTTSRAVAAIGFYYYGTSSLDQWAQFYLLANAFSLMIMAGLFYPSVRLRWKPKVWIARVRDAFSVSAAEVLFYLQMELDKILVLSVGGQVTAGLYAIVMRLVDLTAIPVRSFNMLLIQKIMRQRNGLKPGTKILFEIGIGVISVLGLAVLAIALNIEPGILGKNIGSAAMFIPLVLMIPAFRNLIEYHAELLYAREKMTARIIILAIVGLLKVALLMLVLNWFEEFSQRALAFNFVFAALYITSAVATYGVVLRNRNKSPVAESSHHIT